MQLLWVVLIGSLLMTITMKVIFVCHAIGPIIREFKQIPNSFALPSLL